MRKLGQLLFLLAIIQIVTFFSSPISAQKLKPADVPADVTQTLEFQYPYVKVTGWLKEGSNYVATVKDEGTNGKVYISNSGEWLYTHFNIPQNELPSSVMEYVRQNYPDFVVSESYLEEKENEKTNYYLAVKPDGVGAKPSILLFSSTGRNELVSRTDPDDFKDPLTPAEKPAPKAPAPKADKPVADKPAPKADKPKEEATKPVKEPAPKETKPVKETKPAKEPVEKEPKPEKPKKEKPEVVVTDEHGNVALKANTIPEIVTKSLAKKVMHPEDLNWFMIDSCYVAKCVYSGKKTAVYIKPDGMWDKTLTVLPEESVTGPMLKHLNDFYKGFKFKTAVREQRADKQDKTMVDFYEKANYKAKLVTTVIFDKTGKLIRTIDPDYQLGEGGAQGNSDDDALDKYYDKMNMTLDNDDSKSVPENVKAAFRLKYPRVTNVEWKEDDEMNYQAIFFSARGKEICVFNSYGEIVETMVMGKVENLNSTIQDYIKKNYKNFKVTEFYTVRRIAEKLNCYKVSIVNKKTNEEETLWFNTSGRPLE